MLKPPVSSVYSDLHMQGLYVYIHVHALDQEHVRALQGTLLPSR